MLIVFFEILPWTTPFYDFCLETVKKWKLCISRDNPKISIQKSSRFFFPKIYLFLFWISQEWSLNIFTRILEKKKILLSTNDSKHKFNEVHNNFKLHHIKITHQIASCNCSKRDYRILSTNFENLWRLFTGIFEEFYKGCLQAFV